jgi:hypothetical protein
MGVTGHYIDSQFKLHHTLIDFIHIKEEHSGENLAAYLNQSLLEIGLREKVSDI